MNKLETDDEEIKYESKKIASNSIISPDCNKKIF